METLKNHLCGSAACDQSTVSQNSIPYTPSGAYDQAICLTYLIIRVLRLVPDLDEEGNMTFFETELYYADRLTAERPLVLGMVFHGDTPGYGISYTDGNGRTRRFYIGMSGDEGSLFLGEF